MIKRDFRNKPFKVMVVVGEAVAGSSEVTEETYRWATILADQINQFQEQPITVFTKPVEPTALSQRKRAFGMGQRSSANKVDEDVSALNPDLLVLACGLNDMRVGNAVGAYRDGIQRLIDRIRQNINPVIVLVNLSYMWKYHAPKPWVRGGPEQAAIYNLAIKQLAEKNHAILADVYSAQNFADWTIDAEGLCPNELGHRLIGNRVFEAIASNCSCLGTKAIADTKNSAEKVTSEAE